MKTYSTNSGQAYVVTAIAVPCVVNAVMPDNKKVQLAKVDEVGQGSFVAVSDEIEVSQDSAIITPVFKVASLGVGFGGGGELKGVSISKDEGVEYEDTRALGYSSIAIGRGAVSDGGGLALGTLSESAFGIAIGNCSVASSGNSVFGGYSTNVSNSENNMLIATNTISGSFFYGPRNGGGSLILAANNWRTGGAFLEIIGGESPQVIAGVVSTNAKVNGVRVTMTQFMEFLKSIGGVIYNS